LLDAYIFRLNQKTEPVKNCSGCAPPSVRWFRSGSTASWLTFIRFLFI